MIVIAFISMFNQGLSSETIYKKQKNERQGERKKSIYIRMIGFACVFKCGLFRAFNSIIYTVLIIAIDGFNISNKFIIK